jgi:hypothetical protein
MFKNGMKKIFDLHFPFPITYYIGNKYFNSSGRPYWTKEDPYKKMPYNSYLMNRLKSDYHHKFNKTKQADIIIYQNTEFLK